MGLAGRVMFAFMVCISGSFQTVTLPWKMSAMVLPARCNPVGTFSKSSTPL